MWLVNFVYSESVTSGKIEKGGGSALYMWSSIFQGACLLGQGRENLLVYRLIVQSWMKNFFLSCLFSSSVKRVMPSQSGIVGTDKSI